YIRKTKNMAGDRCYLQAFIFSDDSKEEAVVWESDVMQNNVDKFPKKTINGVEEVGVPFYEDILEPTKNFAVLKKMSPAEIQADRRKRSREHFKKEIWETIPKSERKLFRDRSDLKQ